MRRSLFAILFVLFVLSAWAGPRSLPRAHGLAVLPAASVAAATLPPLDVVRLLAEDEANEGRPVPYRIGVQRPLDAGLPAGTLEAIPDGGTLWRLAVTSPGAPWMSVELDGLALTPGLEFRFHDPEGIFVAGPIFGDTIAASGVLASPMVPGDTLIVETYLPAGAGLMPKFRVAAAVTGYKNFFAASRDAGTCNIDINCPEGGGWQADKRAVARIYFSGYLCTGTLLNNTRRDFRNYFLTANHCISTEQTAQKTSFYWNYELTGCGEGENWDYGWQSGSTLRATNELSDFTLLELNRPPDSGDRVYYAGWNVGSAPAQGAVGIHHPSGDVKKISFEYDRLGTAGGSYWRVPHWDLGVTEGGSSGSGLWNMAHQVIGQLTGGASACGNPKSQMWDEYGRLDISWGAGSTADTRLKDWLDPDDTGALSIEGRSVSHPRPLGRP